MNLLVVFLKDFAYMDSGSPQEEDHKNKPILLTWPNYTSSKLSEKLNIPFTFINMPISVYIHKKQQPTNSLWFVRLICPVCTTPILRNYIFIHSYISQQFTVKVVLLFRTGQTKVCAITTHCIFKDVIHQ